MARGGIEPPTQGFSILGSKNYYPPPVQSGFLSCQETPGEQLTPTGDDELTPAQATKANNAVRDKRVRASFFIRKFRLVYETTVILVARGGIEPPTQGFSTLCSTD